MIEGGRESVKDWINDIHFTFLHEESDNKKLQTFKWTAKQKYRRYKSINLNNEKSLFKLNEIFCLFSSAVFHNVKEVSLCLCELDHLEFLSDLKQLELLDVTNNKVAKIPECKNLTKLIISENEPLVNQFNALDIDLKKCPKLGEIVVGSSTLKYINISVIKAVKIYIIEPYSDYVLPSKQLLMDSEKREQYLDSPEKFLTLKKHFDAFWWLVENSDHDFAKKLDLSNQITKDSFTIISRLLSSQNIANVRSLILENCHISSLPIIRSLAQLHTLNLNNNEIDDLSSP